MERRFLTGFIIFSLFVSSCSNPGLYIDVFSGNYAYSRGEYQDANLLYIKAFSKRVILTLSLIISGMYIMLLEKRRRR